MERPVGHWEYSVLLFSNIVAEVHKIDMQQGITSRFILFISQLVQDRISG